jgi:hypothetical protein
MLRKGLKVAADNNIAGDELQNEKQNGASEGLECNQNVIGM